MKRLAMLALGAFLLPPVSIPAGGQADEGLATVHFADGSSVLLRSWTFSYEFLAWTKGTPQFQAETKFQQASAVFADKKTHPVAGRSLTIVYGPPKSSGGAVVKELVLAGGGKQENLPPKPPHRDLLLPKADSSILVLARSLDLRGETLTGTTRSMCLVSYTALVECPSEPDQQVTRIEFQ